MTDLHAARSWYFDVRFRPDTPVTAWPAEFVLVTGYATTGEEWPEERNIAANAQLHAELVAMGRWHVGVTGYSPATGHAEPGFAVEMTAADGEAVGRRYAQDAIYVVRGDALSVRYCADGREEDVEGGWLARVEPAPSLG
jgi:hypothetical protein